jgi:hypothetical protein
MKSLLPLAAMLLLAACKKEETPQPELKRNVEYIIEINGVCQYSYRDEYDDVHSGTNVGGTHITRQFDKGSRLYLSVSGFSEGANPRLTIKVNGAVHAERSSHPYYLNSTVP